MFNRYWNFTTCLRCDDLTAIEQAVTSLLEQEQGCRRLSQLPPLVGSLEQLQAQHPSDQSCHVWIVSLFPGNDGWTIVKTWPTELLCHPVAIEDRPRLSALAMQLGCDAFHLGVDASLWGFLLEANTAGCIYVSGTYGPNIYSEQFYQQPIDAPDWMKQFSILEVPEQIQAAMQVNQDPKLQQRLAELERLAEENPNLKYDFDWECEVYQGYTERIDQALATVMSSSDAWYLADLAYRAYANLEKLTVAGSHLLCFRLPFDYKPPCAYTLTASQWNELFGELSESQHNEMFGLEPVDD